MCHLSKVERWPMLMTVVPGSAVRRRYIFSSVSSSIALVASSRKTHFGFLRNTRTKANFCCSPKERMWLQSASVSGFSIKWERPHSTRSEESISSSAVFQRVRCSFGRGAHGNVRFLGNEHHFRGGGHGDMSFDVGPEAC